MAFCDLDDLPFFWDCRAFFYAIRGFWIGVIVTLALQAWAVRRLLLGPPGSKGRTPLMAKARQEEEEPASLAQQNSPVKDQFPENIVSWLRKATMPSGNSAAVARGMVDASATETCFFLNVYVHRYFLELRRSELLKARWKLKVLQKLAGRMESLSLISSLTFTDFDFGVDAPMFHGARVLKYYSDKAEITLELDTTYKGGLTVGVEVTLATGGITIPVVVKLTGLTGRMRLRVPSRIDPLHFDITFAEDPNATFEVVSGLYLKDSEYLKETITKYLNSKVSKLFADFWTYPAWRNLELPMINRKVTDPVEIPKYVGVVRESVDGKPSAHVWTSGKLTNVATTPAGTSLAPVPGAKAPALPAKKAAQSAGAVPDVLADAVFSLDTVVRASNVEQLQTRLATTFVQLVKEDTKIAAKGLEAWKTIKTKDGITQQRKKILLPGTVAGSALTASEFNRTTFRVGVDAERVFQILSKPEHQRLVTDSFSGAIEIKRFDENSTVWFYKYRFGKTPAADRVIKVFELRRKRVNLGQDSDASLDGKGRAWVVVYRSIAGITPDEEPQGVLENLEAMVPDRDEAEVQSMMAPEADTGSLSKAERELLGDDVSLAPLDEWPESSEDKELAESLQKYASREALPELAGTSPVPSIARGEIPGALSLASPSIPSSGGPGSTATPASSTPSLTFSDHSAAFKHPQNLNQTSSSSSINSGSGKPTAPLPVPAGGGSRLPSLVRSADKTAVKGDAGFFLEDTLAVHIYGYLVESASDDPHSSNVTMLTQYSSKSIQRLESSWELGKQLKSSIEELASLSALPAGEAGEDPATSTVRSVNRSGRTGGADEDGRSTHTERGQRIDKLKSLAAGAGKKAYSWWAGKTGQSSTIGNAVAAGAAISSGFDAADNTLSSSKLLDPSLLHTVLFDDGDSDDDGGAEADNRSDEDDNSASMPREAMKGARGLRLLRRPVEKVQSQRQGDDAEVLSVHSQQDDGDAAETRSNPGSMNDDGSGKGPESMANLYEPPAEKSVQSLDIRKVAYQDFVITSKQGARLDVPFNGDFSTATEFAWDFKIKSPDAVNFAILFKPSANRRLSTSSLGAIDDRFLRSLQDSELEPGAKVVVPMSPVFAMTRAVRGRIATSGFPAGTFIALWDNAYSRKTDKTLSYKVKLQPIRVLSTSHIPRPHFSQEMGSTVIVRTRTAFRAQLFYTEEIERLSIHGSSSPSQNPDRGQTYLQWEFSTGGYDIFFKIVFNPVDTDALAGLRGISDASIDPLTGSKSDETPPASPQSMNEKSRSLSGSPVLGSGSASLDPSSARSQSWGGQAGAPNSRSVLVVPSVKCNSQKGAIRGSLLITRKTGIYSFVWDNTASLVTNKHISFRAGTLTFT